MNPSSQVITLQNTSLSGELREYTFYWVETPGLYTLTIPGIGGGPEGPRDPKYPEQQEWICQFGYLKEVWHLTWECRDEYKFRKFIRAVKGLGKVV